jgi:alanyl-tRNA synthetase
VQEAKAIPGGSKLVIAKLDQVSPKQLREVADDLKRRLGSGCIALATVAEGKAVFLTAVTDDLVSHFHAGKLLEEMAKILGSKGGGRADLAQAGGGDPGKLDLALARFQELCSAKK